MILSRDHRASQAFALTIQYVSVDYRCLIAPLLQEPLDGSGHSTLQTAQASQLLDERGMCRDRTDGRWLDMRIQFQAKSVDPCGGSLGLQSQDCDSPPIS